MHHTIGFTRAEITELCARIESRELSLGVRRWPPILGLRNALAITLAYLRRNRAQAEMAESYGVSQPTISRAIITPLKKPEGGELLAWQKEFNAQVSSYRAAVEWLVAHFKGWRVFYTDCRRPYRTYRDGFDAARGLFFFAITRGFE